MTDQKLEINITEVATRFQGDQIGRIFAYWAIFYFGQILVKISD
jgi:hypothetical protein